MEVEVERELRFETRDSSWEEKEVNLFDSEVRGV